MKFVLGILCLIYLLMPNLGVVELLPDFIPFVGHLDELAVTFLMTHFFGVKWGHSGERPNLPAQIMILIVGVMALLYLVYPSFGTFELLPDAIPLAGNADEILASLILAYTSNMLREPKYDENIVIQGQLVEDTPGQS